MQIKALDYIDRGIALIADKIGALAKRVEAMEARAPEKGDKGEAGRDADPIDIADVARACAALPEIRTVIDLCVAEAVQEYMRANPPQRGEKGDKGDAGVGVAGAVINRSGELVITTSDGRAYELGCVQGKDALSVDDLAATFDIERGIVLTLGAGEIKKELAVKVPVLRHVGFWQPGMVADAGNTTTHNGSLWIATRATRQEPGYQSTDWTLAARKGADGQHAPVKIDDKH